MPPDAPEENPVAAGIVDSSPAPAAASPEPVAPAAAPAASVEAAPAVDTPPAAGAVTDKPATGETVPEAAPTLLDEFDSKAKAEAEAKAKPAAAEADKPAAAAADAAKPADGAEPAPAAELAPIDYFAPDAGLTIPETITMDDAQKGEFTTALDAFRADPQKGAQGLLDLAAKSFGNMAEKLVADQWKAFADTNAQWKAQVMADPVLGGAGHNTAMAQVALARDNFASRAEPGTPKYDAEMTEFNHMMKTTGVGNHPAFLRMLHNAARYVREAPMPPADGKPPKDAGRNPGKRGLGSIYTHPTSNPES